MDKTYTLKELADLDSGTTIVCDTIPFIMTCSFFTYKEWEVQIIRNVIEFKKKNGQWPNFMIANTLTFDKCVDEVERVIEQGQQNGNKKNKPEEKFDWKNFDINEPLEQYPIGSMPVKIDDGIFETPLFSMLWLDTNSYQEGIYKLSFGTNPGPDDGEDIDEAKDNEPIKLRKAA